MDVMKKVQRSKLDVQIKTRTFATSIYVGDEEWNQITCHPEAEYYVDITDDGFRVAGLKVYHVKADQHFRVV